jgi:N6-adenosine-specific RNA methylase IME4
MWDDLNPPYSTIVADPPWHYDERVIEYGRGESRSEAMPYSTMSAEEVAALPIYDLVDSKAGTHLYLWTTNRYLRDAFDIAMGWGFTPTQTLVWCKPPRGLSPGGLYANATEFVVFAQRSPKAERREVQRAGHLIRAAREEAGLGRSDLHRAVRGGKPTGIVYRWEDDSCLPNGDDWANLKRVLPALAGVPIPEVPPPPPRPPASMPRLDRNWWEWPRSFHSVKPAAFLDLVEQISPGPYVELFARAPRLGWDSWGRGYEIAS